jgi:flagellar biosynthetic protein FliR
VIQLWVISFVLILVRVGTFVTVMPLFGGQSVPRTVKVGFTLALTVLWFSVFGLVPESGPEWFRQPSWLAVGLALGREMILGGMMGYAFGLFLLPARVAGEFLSQEMGLTLGNLVDPTFAQPAGALTQLYEMLGVLVFLGLDGHHILLAALHGSFVRWPVGGELGALPVQHLVSAATQTEQWGFLLAAPVALCLFITAVVLALMARAVPQMNFQSVGFALRLVVGLVAALLLLPEMLTGVVSLFGHLNELLL